LRVEQQAQALAGVGASLLTTFDKDELMNTLEKQLPRLAIPSVYLALYENPQSYEYPQPAPEWSQLILACDEHGRHASELEGQRFPSRRLLPEDTLPQERSYVMMVEPLYFQEQQLGYVLFETGPRDGMIYESLRVQISNALQGALLMHQVQENTIQLDTVVVETLATMHEMQATVLGTSEQAQTVADAAQQSVNVSLSGQAAVTDTVAGMETIQRQVKEITQNALALSKQTQQIGQIVSAVKEIANQSHLLALNVNIEAARLGEKGRAFAVLAKEMRHLATKSSEATLNVRDILTEIQQTAERAVTVTEQGGKDVQRGMELASRAGDVILDLSATIDKSAQAATSIAAATHQQIAGMNQLAESMQSIKQASSQTTVRTGLAGVTSE
jgi:hypothetical protein